MLPKENYKDDLEYLAQQGFEKVSVTDSDLADLKKRVRTKTVSFNSFYIGLSSLLIGMVIGGVLFYLFYKNTESKEIALTQTIVSNVPEEMEPLREELVYLDTVHVTMENFIKPAFAIKVGSERKVLTESSPSITSAEVMRSKPIDPSLLNINEISETQLKYIINAPVFYLHDLKITNYTTLYFKKERFVKFTGVSAAYPDKNEGNSSGTSLKQNSEQYLHEEIAHAMLLFKNEKYDQTIQALKTVSNYNKEDLNCDFYLAMCYYHQKKLNLAIDYFDKCLSSLNNTFLQEAMYYKAVSLNEKGNQEQAKELFKKIVEGNEFYSSMANDYLRK
jgi:hypothetical protein